MVTIWAFLELVLSRLRREVDKGVVLPSIMSQGSGMRKLARFASPLPTGIIMPVNFET
jgi:hypothetical protein